VWYQSIPHLLDVDARSALEDLWIRSATLFCLLRPVGGFTWTIALFPMRGVSHWVIK
jgi:hypothetical protein